MARGAQLLHDREEPDRSGVGHAGGGGRRGGGGDVVAYRLDELERRMGEWETDVKSIGKTVTEINTKMDSIATKAYVLTLFGITGGLAVLAFIGHLLIRILVGSPPP